VRIKLLPSLIAFGCVAVSAFAQDAVRPDIPVLDDPSGLTQDRDPQLERAIVEVEKSLQQNPPQSPKKTAHPIRIPQ